MNCMIIEDQPPAQRILAKYIADMGTLTLRATFPDALSALEYLKTHTVDLIFLDMHLPQMSGFDFLKTLPNPPAVILTTAFPDYALESYEFSVADYLLKPFSFQRFEKAVSKVSAKSQATALPQEVFVKSGYERVKVRISDIFYIKSDADYTEILFERPSTEVQETHAQPVKRILSSEPLRYWEETLGAAGFVRTHKSYLVNTARVEKITSNQLLLPYGLVAPIGRAFKSRY
jgi:DNA-binding LytR/AlgR family response regulator